MGKGMGMGMGKFKGKGRGKGVVMGCRFAMWVAVFVMLSGCVRRTISITTEPPGALAYLNDREVGRTPLDVDFVHYGTYSVRLELEGYESMLTSGDAKPPWWDTVGVDFFSELTPADLHSEVHWHYDLEPEVRDRQALVERAREMRETVD